MDVRERVLQLAREEGFSFTRIAPAAVLEEAREAALQARAGGRLDGLGWMTGDWLIRATDPARFLSGARSVVMVALSYAPGEQPRPAPGPSRGRVAAYARGRDYHRVFEKKLRRMARVMREELGASARPTVDYGPLLERPLAAVSGMGWLGKSTMLLVPGAGPWVLLGAIATDLALVPDRPLKKSCGSCARCVTACPTGALGAHGTSLDARLCISFHTIENRGPIPRELRSKFGDWVFGCDDCLTSCPVGQRPSATAAPSPELEPSPGEEAGLELAPLLALDEESFAAHFRGRPIMRAKRDGFLRNVCVALGNVGTEDDLPGLMAALADRAPLVRGHAAWALAELARRLPGALPALPPVFDDALARETEPWVREELAVGLAALKGP